MSITELLWWVYSHFTCRKWNMKMKANLYNWKNGQAFRHIQTWAAFSACIRQSNKKRSPPPTNVASLASLGTDRNGNDAVTKIKARNYEVLTNFGCQMWETWSQSFFEVFFEDIVFSKYLSHWSHLQLWLIGFSADLSTGVLGWVPGKWGQCSLLGKFWFMWSALNHVGVQWPFAKDGFSSLKHELIFLFFYFPTAFIAHFPTSLMKEARVLMTHINRKFTLSWDMAILSAKWAISLQMSTLL